MSTGAFPSDRGGLFAADVSDKHVRVYLDDERPTPDGWVSARWPDEVIRLLETGKVAEVSLDHDLGDDVRGTGYDVILWIEEAVVLRGFKPPLIHVHSANAAARSRMLAGIDAIERAAVTRATASPEPGVAS